MKTSAAILVAAVAMLACSAIAGAAPIVVGIDYEGTWLPHFKTHDGGGTVSMVIETEEIDTDKHGWVKVKFKWLCTLGGGSCSGEELASGTLSTAGHLDVTGYELLDDRHLALGHCRGDFSGDYLCISDGLFANAGSSRAIGSWKVAAVPEPATLGLMGIGLAGIGFARRKRRN